MKKDPQNLKIRVVMKPTATAPVHGQYRTNWARVAVIAVPVVLVLGLLSAKFLFDKPGTAPSSDLVLDSNALDGKLDTHQANDSRASAPTLEPEATEASPPLPTVADLEEVEVEELEGQEAEARVVEEQIAEKEFPDLQQLGQLPEEPELAVETSVNDASTDETSLQPAAPTNVASDVPVAEVSTSQAAALQAGETRVISPAVKRFQLAAGIRNKEPRGTLEDINDDDSADGVLTVYAFAEVINIKDQQIRYRWLRNGKPAATVKVGVWSNKYRSHSSKYITRGMRGDWQVRLENSQGELLAEATFRY